MDLGESAEVRLVVDDGSAGERLDRFVARMLRLSRGQVRRLLTGERVFLAGRRAVKGSVLRAGDVVAVLPFRRPEAGAIAEPGAPLHVIRDEGGLVAVDKPAGVPTHPLGVEETGTLTNAFLDRFPEARGVGPNALEPGLVHRLDTDTSGVVLFAKEPGAFERARRALRSGSARKIYTARVHGVPERSGEVRLELTGSGPKVRVVTEGGRLGVLQILSIEPEGETARVDIRLVTGLRHQIRATLAHLGHPVLGDALYGSTLALDRHLLHATELSIDDFVARSDPGPILERSRSSADQGTMTIFP